MRSFILALVLLVSTAAVAQNWPDYYPREGFSRSGVVDVVYADENRIVINDVSYKMNARPIVRSLSSSYDSMARIRPGVRVAFRVDQNREIVEFWLLPKDYEERRRRGGRR